MTIIVSMISQAVLSGIIFAARNYIVEAMTSDELIGEYVVRMLPLVCLTNIFDAVVACFMGFVRALDS